MKNRVQALALLAATVGSIGLVQTVSAGPASAADHCMGGHFCAFANANFNVTILDSTAGEGSNGVDVSNDQTSSGSNSTLNDWVGVTKRTNQRDETVFIFAPNSENSYIGDNANDKIDHFDVR